MAPPLSGALWRNPRRKRGGPNLEPAAKRQKRAPQMRAEGPSKDDCGYSHRYSHFCSNVNYFLMTFVSYTRQDMAHHCANCPKCPEAERNEARETLRRQDARKALKSASKASKKVTVQAQKAPPTPPQAQRPTRTASVPTEITPLRLGLPTQRDLSVHSENAGEIPGPPYEQSLSNNAIATHQKATSLSGYIPRHPSSTSRTPNHHTAIQPTPLQAQRPTRTAPSPTEYPPLPDLGLPTQRDLSVY
ncbi:hypothetical protein C0991_011005, partial [Blastosporella zonata]